MFEFSVAANSLVRYEGLVLQTFTAPRHPLIYSMCHASCQEHRHEVD